MSYRRNTHETATGGAGSDSEATRPLQTDPLQVADNAPTLPFSAEVVADRSAELPETQPISAFRSVSSASARAYAHDVQDPTETLPTRSFDSHMLSKADSSTRLMQTTQTLEEPSIQASRSPYAAPRVEPATPVVPATPVPPRAAVPNVSYGGAPYSGVPYPNEAFPPASQPGDVYSPVGVTSISSVGRPMRPGEGDPKSFPSIGLLMRHLFALLFLGASLFGAFRFFIYTHPGQQVDEQAYTEYSSQFHNYRGPTLTALDSLPVIVGVVAVLGLIAVLVWKHRFLPALVGVLCGVGACITTYALKNYVIVKPDWGIQEAVSNSAPSGHTTFAAAAGAALFLAVPRLMRPTVALLAAVATCLTGASTIINGWHRPVDVVTAILVTAMWTVLGMALLRYVRRGDFTIAARGGLVLVPLLTIATLFLSFCSVILYLIAIFSPIPGGAFTAATCMIVAVSFGTTALMVNLLRARNGKHSS